MRKMILAGSVLVLVAANPPAAATDAVAAGLVSGLTYREGYVMFQLKGGASNSCSPCPYDPGHFAGGTYCWIAQTQNVQIAMLLQAKAQGLMVSGRVNAIASDCTVYQMTVADN